MSLNLPNNVTQSVIGINCQDIMKRGHSWPDGMYWLDPDEGSHSNAYLAHCDLTSYNGGWTMCYTTDEYAKPKTEIAYNAQFPYGADGYRTNCNNIPVSEFIIAFLDYSRRSDTMERRIGVAQRKNTASADRGGYARKRARRSLAAPGPTILTPGTGYCLL